MIRLEEKTNLKEILKSILFVAGDGLERSFLIEKLGISEEEFESAFTQLKEDFKEENGIQLIMFKNKIQLSSNNKYADIIAEILNPIREKSLTRAALETLAIITYKQPITKLEIEDVRRVNCDYAVQVLMDQDMIEIVGRKDAIGHPLLFGTTENFLKRFNITNVQDLPDYQSLLNQIKVVRDQEGNRDTLFKNPEDFKFAEESENAKEDEKTDEDASQLKEEDFFEIIEE